MVYNPTNKLYKVLKIQNIYLKYSEEGVTDIYIYNKYIRDQFDISLRTFYNYLAIPAQNQLKKMGKPIEKPSILQMRLAL